jgi:hypothetical protein
MNHIYHIARADFLQRARSYRFLITLGICAFLTFSIIPPPGAVTSPLSIGPYRGINNSAWIGSVMAIVCGAYLSIAGFYLVNDALKRDEETGVGEIIAAAQVRKLAYLVGKFFSNLAVLLIILMVVGVMSILVFLVKGESGALNLWKLWGPLLVYTMPSLFLVAGMAIFLESFPGLNKGVINILYFFLWIFIIVLPMQLMKDMDFDSKRAQFFDITGVGTGLNDLGTFVQKIDPTHRQRSLDIAFPLSVRTPRTFTWEGKIRPFSVSIYRFLWMPISFVMVLLASIFFRRFETKYTRVKISKKTGFNRLGIPSSLKKMFRWKIPAAAVKFDIINHSVLLEGEKKFNFYRLVGAELKLMLKGRSRWWLLITLGLFIAALFAPMPFASVELFPLLWFCQVLLLSQLGCRELKYDTSQYIYSAAFPLKRQVPAAYLAAVLILLILALPIFIRCLAVGDTYGVFAVVVGGLFVPALAFTCGTLTNGSKLFEILYTSLWIGVRNQIPAVDFMGVLEKSRTLGLAYVFLFFTAILLIVTVLGRKRQITAL